MAPHRTYHDQWHGWRVNRAVLAAWFGIALMVACTPNKGGDTAANGTPDDANSAVGGLQPGNGNNVVDSNGTVVQQPNGPAIAYRGRFEYETDSPNVPIMSWPGTEMLFGFRGSQLSVSLAATDPATYDGVGQAIYMAYAVDGGNTQTLKLSASKSDYVLAQSLAAGQHTVRLAKMTEAQLGRVWFYGATTDGAMTYTPPVSGRRLEFIGDSGTAGYGTLGKAPCSFSAATENADVAYPAVVGRALNAEARNISYSGKGLIQNRDVQNDSYKTMPILWQWASPREDANIQDPNWDFNQWKPQAVVATVSGNDVYASIPTQDMFNTKVGGFIKSLRAAYPQAVLFFGVSPMLRSNDPRTGQRTSAIANLKNTLTAANDPNVSFIELPQDNGFFGTNCGTDCTATDPTCLGSVCVGCDSHMTPYTQRLVADAIVSALKARLKW